MNNNTGAQTTSGTTVASVPATPSSEQHNLISSLMLPFLILIAFYFLLMRPQQKRDARRRNMVNSLKRGDRIVTAGGIIGSVHKIVGDKEISMEVAEGIRLRILKSSVAEMLVGESISIDEVGNGSKKATNVLRKK
ncbi:MAG: preprotein translocase subunit YajC [Holosporaceae bacterium]|jgi:preprotein translocase subunit YajC|nr:preprotein translocase subunit YajC [Holosporaceae bacterium]